MEISAQLSWLLIVVFFTGVLVGIGAAWILSDVFRAQDAYERAVKIQARREAIRRKYFG